MYTALKVCFGHDKLISAPSGHVQCALLYVLNYVSASVTTHTQSQEGVIVNTQ